MNKNFKGEYKFQERLTPNQVFFNQSVRTKSELCLWTMCRESMDSVDIVESTCRTLSRVSVNNVYGLCGQSPSSSEADWTMSTVPWTLSSETMDIVHCTLDFVHELSGQSPWTLSSLPEFSWTLSTESMDIVQTVH